MLSWCIGIYILSGRAHAVTRQASTSETGKCFATGTKVDTSRHRKYNLAFKLNSRFARVSAVSGHWHNCNRYFVCKCRNSRNLWKYLGNIHHTQMAKWSLFDCLVWSSPVNDPECYVSSLKLMHDNMWYKIWPLFKTLLKTTYTVNSCNANHY